MTASPNALIGDPQYPRLKEHLIESTGLIYYLDRDADLARRLERRLSTTGVRNCTDYLTMLRDPLRGPPEVDALIAEITIGETYFFRHQEHFDALRNLVFPDLIFRNRTRNPPRSSLRIWSAGCADGPEPYSLAILLKREMAHQLPGLDITILGTDLNRNYLARAREGMFDQWDLRCTSETIRDDCFTKQGAAWKIRPEYREMVTFQCHNLAEQSAPALNHLSAFDLIVCRNVMIYFGPETMQKIVDQFYHSLLPGGWLVVGPAEPNMTCFTSFRAVNAPGVTLYQKPEEPPLPTPFFEPFEIPSLPPVPGPPVPSPVIVEISPAPAAATLETARRSADSGDWEQAARCCQELLEHDPLNASIHLHHALVEQQRHQPASAEAGLRRAIYLDRKLLLAHYHLGLLLQSKGDAKQAARSFENVLQLLKSRPDADIVPDADGITTAELRQLASMHLELLQERL